MKFIEEDRYKDLSGIYKITNTKNNKVYIGQTTMRFIKRFWHHQWKLRHGTHDNGHLQAAWNKYGEDSFDFQVVHVLEDGEDINELEIKYIKEYDSVNNGYNIQTGGQEHNLRFYIPESTWKHVGELNRQRMLGTKLPESTKQHMRESSHKGEDNIHSKITEADVRKIRELYATGEYSQTEIGNMFDISNKNVGYIVRRITWKHVA